MEDALFYARLVLSRTPPWAYLVLIALCLLGSRRTASRPTSAIGLAVVPMVFLTWSLIGAAVFGSVSGVLTATTFWAFSLVAGLFSFRLVGPPSGEWIDRRKFLRTGSWGPLAVYVGIFFFRYGLEIWAGFWPEHTQTAHAIAVILSGFMAGRTIGDLWQAIRFRPLARHVR